MSCNLKTKVDAMKATNLRDQVLTAWLLAAIAAAVLLWQPLPHEWDIIGLAFIVLAATAVVRFEPKHTFALGLTIWAMYFLSCSASDGWHFPAITAHRGSH